MPLGLYISVPFCRTKCSYCNFASDVFSRTLFRRYVDRVCADIARSREICEQAGGVFDDRVDTVYLGGGTPTVLDIAELERLFVTISQNFTVQRDAELSVECAPGTLSATTLDLFQRCGVNRLSLGAQSFIDQEARSVGRLHTQAIVADDIGRLRASGIENINVDLIAGLPHQSVESWKFSLCRVIDSGVPHVSVYMLEVDEDSRLGRELIAGGTRYHAHFVPDEDVIAHLYEIACEQLDNAGICQYEISNFARTGYQSRHNLKYWTRQPYLGFGVDAHSMLPALPGHENASAGTGTESGTILLVPPRPLPLSFRAGFSPRGICFSACGPAEAIRFATPEALDNFLSVAPLQRTFVSSASALEESLFLGLRLNRGVNLSTLAASFGSDAVAAFLPEISNYVQQELLQRDGDTIRLTLRGRLLSNEVFSGFLAAAECSG